MKTAHDTMRDLIAENTLERVLIALRDVCKEERERLDRHRPEAEELRLELSVVARAMDATLKLGY